MPDSFTNDHIPPTGRPAALTRGIEQVVLSRREPHLLGPLPTPLEEPAKADAELQQGRVVLVSEVCEPIHR